MSYCCGIFQVHFGTIFGTLGCILGHFMAFEALWTIRRWGHWVDFLEQSWCFQGKFLDIFTKSLNLPLCPDDALALLSVAWTNECTASTSTALPLRHTSPLSGCHPQNVPMAASSKAQSMVESGRQVEISRRAKSRGRRSIVSTFRGSKIILKIF